MRNSSDFGQRALRLVAVLAFFAVVGAAGSAGAPGGTGQGSAGEAEGLDAAAAVELSAACANRYGSHSGGWYLG